MPIGQVYRPPSRRRFSAQSSSSRPSTPPKPSEVSQPPSAGATTTSASNIVTDSTLSANTGARGTQEVPVTSVVLPAVQSAPSSPPQAFNRKAQESTSEQIFTQGSPAATGPDATSSPAESTESSPTAINETTGPPVFQSESVAPAAATSKMYDDATEESNIQVPGTRKFEEKIPATKGTVASALAKFRNLEASTNQPLTRSVSAGRGVSGAPIGQNGVSRLGPEQRIRVAVGHKQNNEQHQSSYYQQWNERSNPLGDVQETEQLQRLPVNEQNGVTMQQTRSVEARPGYAPPVQTIPPKSPQPVAPPQGALLSNGPHQTTEQFPPSVTKQQTIPPRSPQPAAQPQSPLPSNGPYQTTEQYVPSAAKMMTETAAQNRLQGGRHYVAPVVQSLQTTTQRHHHRRSKSFDYYPVPPSQTLQVDGQQRRAPVPPAAPPPSLLFAPQQVPANAAPSGVQQNQFDPQWHQQHHAQQSYRQQPQSHNSHQYEQTEMQVHVDQAKKPVPDPPLQMRESHAEREPPTESYQASVRPATSTSGYTGQIPTRSSSDNGRVLEQSGEAVVKGKSSSDLSNASGKGSSTDDLQLKPIKIFVIYYTLYGHIKVLADCIKEGIDSVPGCKAELYRVPETLESEVLKKMRAPSPTADPVLTHDMLYKLQEADGIIFGIPTRFGMMPAQMKAFFDSTGKLWQQGQLIGKPAGMFFSTATQGGGQETTALTTITQLTHHGMIYVPIGYSFGGSMFDNSEVHGGSPYGAGTIANGDGSRIPSAYELGMAAHQGASFASIARKLAS